ncbi:hypothetical protein PtA15_17A205 [Puccinia triticina]|uniref:Uncharacterized protein n=1 Tax=Puccinia triticina TaxID=208348 RepID=A0ABY7D519_9BASI|nr:uncharacterized protein PtA15_17A205 [Puccinia triticina]WAQ92723.1 hypothetical protein PtA15_17A205 [Puccinia triticina]
MPLHDLSSSTSLGVYIERSQSLLASGFAGGRTDNLSGILARRSNPLLFGRRARMAKIDLIDFSEVHMLQTNNILNFVELGHAARIQVQRQKPGHARVCVGWAQATPPSRPKRAADSPAQTPRLPEAAASWHQPLARKGGGDRHIIAVFPEPECP